MNHSIHQLEAIHQREHKDARFFWIPEQVQDKDFSIKKERIAQKLEGCQSLLQYYNVVQIPNGYSTRPWIAHSTQDEGEEPMMDLVTVLHTRYEYRDLRHVYAEASVCVHRELRCRFGNTSTETETETDSCQCFS